MATNCSKCGGSILSNAKFCNHCGSSISATTASRNSCPNCGSSLRPNVKFCGICGFQLQQSATAADPLKKEVKEQPTMDELIVPTITDDMFQDKPKPVQGAENNTNPTMDSIASPIISDEPGEPEIFNNTSESAPAQNSPIPPAPVIPQRVNVAPIQRSTTPTSEEIALASKSDDFSATTPNTLNTPIIDDSFYSQPAQNQNAFPNPVPSESNNNNQFATSNMNTQGSMSNNFQNNNQGTVPMPNNFQINNQGTVPMPNNFQDNNQGTISTPNNFQNNNQGNIPTHNNDQNNSQENMTNNKSQYNNFDQSQLTPGKNPSSIVPIILIICILIVAGINVFLYRDKIFGNDKSSNKEISIVTTDDIFDTEN